MTNARPCLYCEHLTESGGCKVGGYSVCRAPSDAADKVAAQLAALAPGDEIVIRFDAPRRPMRARVIYRASGYTYTDHGVLGATGWAWMEFTINGKSQGTIAVGDVSLAI